MGLSIKKIAVSAAAFAVSAVLFSHQLQSQASCIWTADEPQQVQAVSQSVQWTQEGYSVLADWDIPSLHASVILPSLKKSKTLRLDQFDFGIPEGSIIQGVKVKLTGRSDGGGLVRDVDVRLRSGQKVSQNKVHPNFPIKSSWPKTTGSWYYGYASDTWGVAWTAEDFQEDFSLELTVRNALKDEVEAHLVKAEVIVYYTALPVFCKGSCPTVYVDKHPDIDGYSWSLPPGFTLISKSQDHHIIDLHVEDYVVPGIYKICAQQWAGNTPIELCCREISYVHCVPGSIGDFVWADVNANGIQEAGEVGIQGIVVRLFDETNVQKAQTTTNAAGKYAFQNVEKGRYYVRFEKSANFEFAPFISSQAASNSDVVGQNGPGTTALFFVDYGQNRSDIDAGLIPLSEISGQVWEDQNGDGQRQVGEKKLEGIELELYDGSGIQLTTTVTDAQGMYRFEGLFVGKYSITIVNSTDFLTTAKKIGSSGTDSDFNPDFSTDELDLPVSGLANIDAGLYRLGSISGRAWFDADCSGTIGSDEDGLPSQTLYIMDAGSQVLDTIWTDAAGFYRFEGLKPGSYQIEFAEKAGYTATVKTASYLNDTNDVLRSDAVTIESGENLADFDLGVINYTSSICGRTWFDVDLDHNFGSDDSLLTGLLVQLFSNDSLIGEQFATTGMYCFDDLPPGEYEIVFETKTEKLFVDSKVGPADSDSDADASGRTDVIVLQSGKKQEHIDAGYVNKAILGDFVWLDTDENGVQDAAEPGLAGLKISLYDEQDVLVAEAYSDDAGQYVIAQITPGSYYVVFDKPDSLIFTLKDVDPVSGSDANTSGRTEVFSLKANEVKTDVDAGYLPAFACISGLVWLDESEDGIRSPDEFPLEGIDVLLYDENQNIIAQQATDAEGQYKFADLAEGIYYVAFPPMERMPFTIAGNGPADADSDVTNSVFEGGTDAIDLMAGVNILHIDAGYLPKRAMISGKVWDDRTGNGLREITDMPMPNIVVTLLLEDSTVVQSTSTDSLGCYRFDRVGEGTYFIAFSGMDDCFVPVEANVGPDDEIDSEVTEAFGPGSTDLIAVTGDTLLMHVDAGFVGLGVIGGLAFQDKNENGLMDGTDEGFDDLIFCLLDEDGNTVAKDTLSLVNGQRGVYRFDSLLPGKYTVQVFRPLFYIPTIKDAGNDTLDSDFGIMDGIRAYTDTLVIESKTVFEFVNLGLIFRQEKLSNINGGVWIEEGADGIRDVTETWQQGVVLRLKDDMQNEIAVDTTDAEGQYHFGPLAEGFYYVEVEEIADRTTTFYGSGSDHTTDNDFRHTNGIYRTDVFYLGIQTDSNRIDLGLAKALNIGDYVWEDANFNGLQDLGELGIEGIEIRAFTAANIFVDSVFSDLEGRYEFVNLPATQYRLSVRSPQGMSPTKANAGSDDVDSDFGSDGFTSVIDLSVGGMVDTLDAGLVKNGNIGDRVWVDFNGNGTQQVGEPGISDFVVALYNDDDELIGRDTTSGDMTINMGGFYQFVDVAPGQYYLVFELQDNYLFTDADMGSDDVDSDVTSSITFGSTDLFTLAPGEDKMDMDCGIFEPAKLGDLVWEDKDGDGIQTSDELGIPNVTVTLLRPNGFPITTTVTDENGMYCFTGLKQGLYMVRFDSVPGYSITLMDQGSDDLLDSDADPATGTTPLVSVAHGVNFLGLDCGFKLNNFNTDPIIYRTAKEGTLSEILSASAYPNPAVFETRWSLAKNGEYKISIFDGFGRRCFYAKATVDQNEFRLDLSEFPAGRYTVLFEHSDGLIRSDFVRVF